MKEKPYSLNVDGIGTFQFLPRTLRAEIKIGVEFSRLTEGEDVPGWLSDLCEVVATLKTLTSAAPEGWDVEGMDPKDPTAFERLHRVYRALTDAEARFRGGPESEPQAPGTGAGVFS
jgi:hypothetical protein